MGAKQRVEILIKATGLEHLVAATPIEFCTSDEFLDGPVKDLRCPLDPLEGFVVYEKSELKPWQESKYISFQAAEVERIGREKGLRPHPSEEDRIAEIKESLSK